MMLKYIYINKEQPEFINQDLKSDITEAEKESLEISLKYVEKILSSVPDNEKDLYLLIETLSKFSICVLTIGFYFYIIKNLQNYDLVQYSYFSFLLSDTNGLLVFLKFLNQNPKDIQAQFKTKYEE